MKSGFIALVGRPNVGKSTLLNGILETKVSIVSNKPQTTRNNIQGVYHEDGYQMIFIDTPGIHKPMNNLGKHLNRQALFSLEDADLVLFLVDVTAPLGKGDLFVIEKLKAANKPIILILNKVDKINKDKVLEIITDYSKTCQFEEIIPISSLKQKDIDYLISVLKKHMKDTKKYYEDNQITNQSDEFMITEFVREKVFELTKEEVPHSTACFLQNIEIKKDVLVIDVDIIVDKENIKKIIVGHNGSMIKEIGMRARHDLEKFFNKKIFLNLFVKTVKDWREKESCLTEYGIK